MILTGGLKTLKKVSVYDTNGFVEYLPDLMNGRHHHACGFFVNNEMIKVR